MMSVPPVITGKDRVASASLRLLAVACAFVAVSTQVEAKSLLISMFKGHWRPQVQNCSKFQDGESSVSFGVEADSSSYIQFEKLKCAVQANRDLSVQVANAKSCAKSGFPEMFIGRYSRIRVGDYLVDGYLAFTDSRGEVSIMKDCGALRWWGTQK